MNSTYFLPCHVAALAPAEGYSGDEGTDYISATDSHVAGGQDCILLFETLKMASAAAEQYTAETQQQAQTRRVDMSELGDSGENVMVTLFRANGQIVTLSAVDYRSRIDPDSFDPNDLS